MTNTLGGEKNAMAGPSLEGLVNPDLLVWAREASRIDRATAAKRVGVTVEKVEAWEEGTKFPTLTQLRKIARVYKRSVGVFFLEQRPAAMPQPADFRRMELSIQHVIIPELAAGIRAAEAKRAAALEIYVQREEEPPAFGLALNLNAAPEQVAQQIAEQLGITMHDRAKWGSEYDALNAWKAAVEARGVLVMQISRVPVSDMRGCSLALFPLPVIILNSSDKPLGRIFTLLHELVHLARAESGLCDVFEDAQRGDQEQQIETYCNRIAGATLVPVNDLLQHPVVAGAPDRREWGGDEIMELRRLFWASWEVILRRLLIAGKTTQQFYRVERERLRRQYANDEGASAGGFVTPPRRVVLSNGRFLTGLVVDAYDSSVITGSDLSRILGTKLDHLPKIIDVLKEREAA